MYLSKIRVRNYKSFRDSGEIEFKQGINLIVGQNNSGKTTLLEALEINFTNISHLSVKKAQQKTISKDKTNNSLADYTLTLSTDEIPSLEEYKLNNFYERKTLLVPFPETYKELIYLNESYIKIHTLDNDSDEELKKFRIQKEESNEILKEYIQKVNDIHRQEMNLNFKYLNQNLLPNFFNYGFIDQEQDMKATTISLDWNNKSSKFEVGYDNPNRKDEITDCFGWEQIIQFKDKIYRFSAERPNLGVSLVGFNKELNPNGSNLAEVLQNIKNDNPDVFDEFNEYVSEVLPSVKWVSSVRIENKDQAFGTWNEVRVWSVEKKTRRTDLAFPLSACGTGIGQVLAILYVVVASEEPRTIIIDEPNSFLHPGAAKKLIQILNKFPQHQYFISTHSPEVLSAAKPSTITRLKYIDGETVAESINVEQTKDLREILNEIGIRFSDVFFAENILWVEGPTEAQAFPLILEKEKDLFDVTFLPLVNTGDLLQKKQARQNAKLAFEIYNRLSGAHALTPPFVAVVIDKEETTEQELKELKKISKNKVEFIPRRMFENYLLDAQAIAEVYNSESNLDKDKKISAKKVENWIAEKRENKDFLPDKLKSKKGIKDKEWLENVDAAKLLADLFTHFSDKTLEYRKTTHSVKLTQWLLDNKPEQLAELREFLINLVADKHSS